MKEVAKYEHCFVCGDSNADGLQAKFFEQPDGSVVSEIEATAKFQGYRSILHGGILSTMLDEVMIKAVLARGVFAVTAEMTVRLRRPVLIGQRIRFTGSVTEHNRRLYRTEGTAINDSDEIVASASGLYIEAHGDLLDSLKESVEQQ
jgi:uncharacterized protein (TIGR00369 family)